MGTPKGERWGGRAKGTPNQLPDLRAITLKALMKAGGVDYLVRQANDNPMGFLSLLGRVMPRESHVELSGELRIRQEVRKDLVEKLVILMRATPPEPNHHDKPAIEGSQRALPAITHQPDTMLKASVLQDRESLSRRAENARREGASVLSGVVQRAAAMHIENDSVQSVLPDAPVMSPGVREGLRDAQRDPGTPIENTGAVGKDGRGVLPRGRPYVCPPATPEPVPAHPVEHNASGDSPAESGEVI